LGKLGWVALLSCFNLVRLKSTGASEKYIFLTLIAFLLSFTGTGL
jgi:hypothetical protein